MARRKVKILLWTLPLLILAAGFAFVCLSPQFRIADIDVAGNNRVSEREIRSILPFGRGDHILFAPLQEAGRIITSDRRIAWVKLDRCFPSEVRIIVGEEHPALLLSADGIWGLSESGKAIPFDNAYEIPNLPILSGLEREVHITPFEMPKSKKLDTGLRFWRTLTREAPEFLDRISEIHVEDDYEVTVIMTGDGLVVHFGRESAEQRLTRLSMVLEEMGMDRAEVESIDLRYSDQAVVRRVEEKSGKTAG